MKRINLTKKDLINSIYMQIGFSKKISEYANCHNKKLLNLFLLPVLINRSGFGESLVYKLLLIFCSVSEIPFFLIKLTELTNSLFEP